MNKNILIAGASLGWGHIQAAHNVSTAILQGQANCNIQSVDILGFLPFGAGLLTEGSWRFMSSHTRNMYSLFYSRSVNHHRAGSNIGLLARYAAVRIANEFDEPPDVFVATHSFAVAIGSLLKEWFNCKLCVVTTDFILHQMHIVPSVDCFFVPPAYEGKAALDRSKPNGQIRLDTGIPIASDFAVAKDVDALKKKFGLSSNLATVLVSFGGSGLRAERHTRLFAQLLELDSPLQFIVLAGRNAKFARAIREQYANHKHSCRIKVYDFVEQVSDFYAVADLFVGKAGGLSISEALAVGLPLTIIDFLPGQEEANLRVLLSHGLGAYVRSTRELKERIESLLSKIGASGRRKEIHEFARPFSSQTIASSVAALAI